MMEVIRVEWLLLFPLDPLFLFLDPLFLLLSLDLQFLIIVLPLIRIRKNPIGLVDFLYFFLIEGSDVRVVALDHLDVVGFDLLLRGLWTKVKDGVMCIWSSSAAKEMLSTGLIE